MAEYYYIKSDMIDNVSVDQIDQETTAVQVS